MEDVLKAISRGKTVLTAELVDHLELALDALRKLANEADAYIVKSAFNQQVLLDTLGRLV